MTEQEKKVLCRLQAQCSRREYCENDVFTKALRAMDGDRESAQSIVDALVRDKFVDNFRYASAYAREKSSLTGWGSSKITYMLSAKRIDRETISAALRELDSELSDKRLETLLRTKARSVRDKEDKHLRLLRFALGRGYSYDEAKRTVGRILNETEG